MNKSFGMIRKKSRTLLQKKGIGMLSLALCAPLVWGDDANDPIKNKSTGLTVYRSFQETFLTIPINSEKPLDNEDSVEDKTDNQDTIEQPAAFASQEEPIGNTDENESDNPPMEPLLPPSLHTSVATLKPAGEIYASSQSFFLENTHHVRDAALSRLQPGLGKPEGSGAWGQAYGEWGRYQGNNSAALKARQAGVLVGVDKQVENWQLGALGGYGRSKLNIGDLNSASTINSYHLGIYAGTSLDKLNLRFGGAYTWNQASTSRNVEISNQFFKNRADYHANTMQFFGEAGYQINATPSVAIEPVVGIAHIRLNNKGLQENGGRETLSAASTRSHVTFSTLGMRMQKAFSISNTEGLLLAGISWRHAFGDVNPIARLSFAGENDIFSIAGAPIAKDAAVINLGLKVKVAKHANVVLSYNGLAARGNQRNSVLAKFIWNF